MRPIPEFKAGDCLLYKPNGLIGDLICAKTWSKFCHVEIAQGDGTSVASRNGIGVGQYLTRCHDLGAVLRPKESFDFYKAMTWFYTKADGLLYDWFGLTAFWFAKWKADPKRMFCSEFATNFYRAGGLDVLHPDWSADQVAHFTFSMLSAGSFMVRLWMNLVAGGAQYTPSHD